MLVLPHHCGLSCPLYNQLPSCLSSLSGVALAKSEEIIVKSLFLNSKLLSAVCLAENTQNFTRQSFWRVKTVRYTLPLNPSFRP
jgi:hypothetical protein